MRAALCLTAVLELLSAARDQETSGVASAPRGMTRREIGERLVSPVGQSDPRLKAALEAGDGSLWRKEGKGAKGDSFRYMLGIGMGNG